MSLVCETAALDAETLRHVMQVCAISVAHNNPEEFARLLHSLQTQADLSGLIVLDNSSDAYLKENEAIFRTFENSYPFVKYIHSTKNVGSAGGFFLGMKIAHENEFDWIWLLDQDGTVDNGCLASLLQNVGTADILCPQIIDIDCPSIVLSQSGTVLNFWGRMINVAFTVSREISFFGTHGALISKKVLDEVGYYDPHHFFVGSEDRDYAFRSTTEHMVIRLVVDAKARHPRAPNKSLRIVDTGVTDSISAERDFAAADRVNFKLFERVEAAIVASIERVLPEGLGHVDRRLTDPAHCCASPELKSLSFAYLATKRLTTWQLVAACSFSVFAVLLRKIANFSRISLKRTLVMYQACLLSKLTNEWPFESVQQFCQHLFK